jgi:hypothetical protein
VKSGDKSDQDAVINSEFRANARALSGHWLKCLRIEAVRDHRDFSPVVPQSRMLCGGTSGIKDNRIGRV